MSSMFAISVKMPFVNCLNLPFLRDGKGDFLFYRLWPFLCQPLSVGTETSLWGLPYQCLEVSLLEIYALGRLKEYMVKVALRRLCALPARSTSLKGKILLRRKRLKPRAVDRLHTSFYWGLLSCYTVYFR